MYSVYTKGQCSKRQCSDEGPMLEMLDYTIRIGSTPTFLYFDLYTCIVSSKSANTLICMMFQVRVYKILYCTPYFTNYFSYFTREEVTSLSVHPSGRLALSVSTDKSLRCELTVINCHQHVVNIGIPPPPSLTQ